MITTICLHDSLLTLRLPEEMIQALQIQDETPVTAELVGGALVIRPHTQTVSSLDTLLAGITPEVIGGEFDWDSDLQEEPPLRFSPTSTPLITQITGLSGPQLEAVLHHGAAIPPTISQDRIVAQLAALLERPWRDVLPILGISEASLTHPSSPSRHVIQQLYQVLDLFAMILAVLDPKEAAHWFTRPNRHLEGWPPLELCRTPEGQARLQDHLDGLLSGNML